MSEDLNVYEKKMDDTVYFMSCTIDDLKNDGFKSLFSRFEEVVNNMLMEDHEKMDIVVETQHKSNRRRPGWSFSNPRWKKSGKSPLKHVDRQEMVVFLYNENTKFWVSVFNHNTPDSFKDYIKQNSETFTHCFVFGSVDMMSGEIIRTMLKRRVVTNQRKRIRDASTGLNFVTNKIHRNLSKAQLYDFVRSAFPDVFEEHERPEEKIEVSE